MFAFYQFNSVKSTGNRRFLQKNSKKVISSVLKALAKQAANHLPERVCGIFRAGGRALPPCAAKRIMKKKYDIIREAMLASGFDLSQLEL